MVRPANHWPNAACADKPRIKDSTPLAASSFLTVLLAIKDAINNLIVPFIDDVVFL